MTRAISPISPDASIPLYQRVKDFVLDRIESGAWPVNHRIPPESALVRKFDTSRMTVNRALRELAQEGRISRRPGLGSFVTDKRPTSALLVIRSIAEEIAERGGTHSARVHLKRREAASKPLATAFGLAPGDVLYHTLIVHMENGTPIQLEDRYVNPTLMPNYLDADFEAITPNEALAAVASVREAQHIVEAILPDPTAARLLAITPATPCLRVYRAATIEGGVSSLCWLTYPGDRYRLSADFGDATGNVIGG